MRRSGDRSTPPALFDIWRVRAIGEWGHASRYVGQRWEEVGVGLLRKNLHADDVVALLPIMEDQVLQSELAATGSKNPDVVAIFREGEQLIARSIDLKWSLDVASYLQISAGILADLCTQVPRLTDDLRARLPEDLAEATWSVNDGFFFAPSSGVNQRFLTSPENKKQEYPIEPKEVRFGTVDPFDFFEPMPGWPTGRDLARMDGASRGLGILDNADRYYYLGAGVAGALASVDQSIFDEEAVIEPDQETTRLRAFLQTVHPPTTAYLIDRLSTAMRHRQDLLRELRVLSRGVYSFKDFAEEVIQRGLVPKGESEAAIRRQYGEIYRTLIEEQDQENRRVGRGLRAKGLTDGQAMEQLTADRDVIARRLRIRARNLLTTAVQNPA